jgi:hypothetical protein
MMPDSPSSRYQDDIEEAAAAGSPHVAPLEITAAAAYSDAGVNFSDDATGTRVMNDSPSAARHTTTTTTSGRKCRCMALSLAALLVLAGVVILSFSGGQKGLGLVGEVIKGGDKGDTVQHAWKQVGDEFGHLNTPDMVNIQEYTHFGSVVALNMDGTRIAIAKQGVSGRNGAVDVYSHFYELTYHPNAWFFEGTLQVPDEGSASAGNHHQTMSMSEDGHRIVFNQGNRAHVYFIDGVATKHWVPLGPALAVAASRHDPATTSYGEALEIAEDGEYVAVWGKTMDGEAFVDIYSYNLLMHGGEIIDEWVWLTEIPLSLAGGATMCFDKMGRRLAIGSYGQDETESSILIYDQSDSNRAEWTRQTDPMGGASFTPGGTYGSVVSLSADGKRLAFGTKEGKGNFVAVMELVQDATGNEEWIPLGKVHATTAEHRHFGASLALSMDGQRLVVGGPGATGSAADPNVPSETQYLYGEVYLYEYNPEKSEWVEVLDAKRSLEIKDSLGASVHISQDGQFVAAGAPLRHGENVLQSGAAVVYKIA